MCLLR